MDPTKDPGIRLAQIFLEEAHFTHREGFLSLPATSPQESGAIEVSFQTGLTPDHKRAVLKVRAETSAEANPLYRLTVVMTALVEVDEQAPNMPLEKYVAVAGVPLLIPFVRQVIADLSTRGRFGPIWLQPLNVRAAIDKTATSPPAEPPTVSSPPAPRARARMRKPSD